MLVLYVYYNVDFLCVAIVSEVYFLIAHFLADSPLASAAKVRPTFCSPKNLLWLVVINQNITVLLFVLTGS